MFIFNLSIFCLLMSKYVYINKSAFYAYCALFFLSLPFAKIQKMKYTIEEYEALLKVKNNGSHSMSYGDKNVTYRSLAEINAILAKMEDELFPECRPRRRRLVSFDRGYFPS